ncbi:hypothetical protein ABZY06_22820 [Streptomyces sp. NPDC006540]|jgi:hypothetical protein|uniref:hypothetical protein n=1 Tax=Streptomyces sp. NPDC006540 TaxID=3155353 RepID=UPI0033BCCDAF
MEIRVEGLVGEAADFVTFTSSLGQAWGRWCGKGVPSVGNHTVEFDVPGVIESWSEVEGAAAIVGDYRDGIVLVRGVIESVDEDGVAGLRVGTDVLLIDVPQNAERVRVGMVVEFTAEQIDIYPYFV